MDVTWVIPPHLVPPNALPTMKSTSRQMLEKSLSAMIAAIEVYNKPDSEYREESFIILSTNAFELLFKAKILADNKNKVRSLYIYNNNKIKRARCGNPMTIELLGAMKRLAIDPAIAENINALVEVRDTAIHYFHKKEIKYVVFTLGVALLRNYQRLTTEWFGRNLSEYNFFIMPLSFIHDFKTLQTIDAKKSPAVVANIVRSVATVQKIAFPGSTYDFACEISAELVSAKKSVQDADMTVKIDQLNPDAIVTITTVKSKLDQYPYTHRQLSDKIKEARPGVKPAAIQKAIREFAMKDDPRYAAYSFRAKFQEEQYQKTKTVPAGTASIYNEDAFRFILSKV